MIAPGRSAVPARSSSEGAVRAAIVSYGAFQALSILGLSAVTVNLPALAADLGVDPDRVIAVATMYLLGFAVGLPLSGRLIDAAGFTRTVRWGLVIFALGSLAAAAGGSLEVISAMRFVAGVASSVMAASGAVLGALLAGERRRLAARSMTMALVVMGSAAPLVGGVVGGLAGWRVAVALPVAILGIGLVVLRMLRARVPLPRPTAGGRVDLVGALLAAGAIVSLVLAGQAGPGWPARIGLLGLAVGLGTAVVWWARRRVDAFVPLAVLTNRPVLGGAAAGHFVALGMSVALIALPLQLADQHGMGVLRIGALSCVAAAVAALATVVATRRRLASPRRLAAALVLSSAAGVALLGVPGAGWWLSLVGLGLTQSAYGGLHGMLLMAAQNGAPEPLRGVSTGVFQAVFYAGGATGAALLSATLVMTDLATATRVLSLLPLAAFIAFAAVPRRLDPE